MTEKGRYYSFARSDFGNTRLRGPSVRKASHCCCTGTDTERPAKADLRPRACMDAFRATLNFVIAVKRKWRGRTADVHRQPKIMNGCMPMARSDPLVANAELREDAICRFSVLVPAVFHAIVIRRRADRGRVRPRSWSIDGKHPAQCVFCDQPILLTT